MNDNDIIRAIIVVLRAGLNRYGLNQVKIKQGYQRRQSGAETGPTLYLHKIAAERWGWPGRKQAYNATSRVFDTTDVFYRAATYQVDGLATQNPANTRQLTASDIVEAAADTLQSVDTIAALSRQRIRIERVLAVRENYFLNDRQQHQQIPSFDFTLTYQVNRMATVAPVTRTGSVRLHRI